MVRQFAEYQVERTAQFQYAFRYDLLVRRLDKFWATVEVDRLLLRPGESQFLCYERAILEYQIDEQSDRELYPELPWSNREPMGIAQLLEHVRRPEVQGTRVTLMMDDELL
jgi:hypothetical protein